MPLQVHASFFKQNHALHWGRGHVICSYWITCLQQRTVILLYAGMVSMLPTTDESLFKIKGGNSRLAVQAISAANATLHDSEVEAIRRKGDSYELSLKVAIREHAMYSWGIQSSLLFWIHETKVKIHAGRWTGAVICSSHHSHPSGRCWP